MAMAWFLGLALALGGCLSGGDDSSSDDTGDGGKSPRSSRNGDDDVDASDMGEPGSDAGGEGSTGDSGGPVDADGGPSLDDAATDAGAPSEELPPIVDSGCSGILTCVADCPDDDEDCIDACYAAGDVEGQNRFLALLTCIDTSACADVDCIETSCVAELVACFDPSPDAEAPPAEGPPTGNIPEELVGRWVRPGAEDVLEFVFGADGSASHTSFKESTLSSCAISVNSEWANGSVVAEGDELTITLAEGVTSVAWIGGCGSGYTNPAQGKVLHYRYMLDTGDQPGLWLTDLACQGEYCESFFRRN